MTKLGILWKSQTSAPILLTEETDITAPSRHRSIIAEAGRRAYQSWRQKPRSPKSMNAGAKDYV